MRKVWFMIGAALTLALGAVGVAFASSQFTQSSNITLTATKATTRSGRSIEGAGTLTADLNETKKEEKRGSDGRRRGRGIGEGALRRRRLPIFTRPAPWKRRRSAC